MRIRLTPISMTSDCYKSEFSENLAGFRGFGGQQQLNECSGRVVTHSIAVDFFVRGLHIRTAFARLP